MLMQAIVRTDWTLEEIHDIYNQPLLELVHRAASVHRQFNDTGEVQVCTAFDQNRRLFRRLRLLSAGSPL